jgi:hypothetical protein
VRKVFKLEEDSAKNNSIILYLFENNIIWDLPRNDNYEIYKVPRIS